MNFSSPHVMGILNITPDSFSDGGEFLGTEKAALRIREMIKEGAHIIDVGGESTGPGSPNVALELELARVKPVIDWIEKERLIDQCVFSIDTYKAPVAEYALTHGFQMVNDVTALRGDPKMTEVLLRYKPYLILMYSKDSSPRTTREATQYDDVIRAIKGFLSLRIDKLLHTGFPKDRILIDPGMGAFVSSDPKYSFEIVERLGELKELGYPICIGPSRKSFLGGNVKERDAKGWEIARKAIANGASVVRMHTIKRI